MTRSYYKLFTLLLCPTTLLIGHLLSYGYSNDLQFEINKDGWLNSFFVKRGWFWTSLIGWWCTIRYQSSGRLNRNYFIRYAILTIWWYMFTQALWFGIAPIMDLIFTLTGGACQFNVFDDRGNLSEFFHESFARRIRSLKKIYGILSKNPVTDDLLTYSLNSIKCALNDTDCQVNNETFSIKPQELNSYIRDALCTNVPRRTSAACRALGGYWIGGHDPSGHIFLITLMVMYLLGELSTFGRRAFAKLLKGKNSRPIKSFIRLFDNGALWNVINNKPEGLKQLLRITVITPPLNFERDFIPFIIDAIEFLVWENPVILLVALLIMWWWSFLVTSVVFHTLPEQISGLAFAYLVAGFIYWNDHLFIHNAMN